MTWPLAAGACAWVIGIAAGVIVAPEHPDMAAPLLAAGAATAALGLAVRPAAVPVAVALALLGMARAEAGAQDPGDRARAVAAAGAEAVIDAAVADDARPAGGGFEVLISPLTVLADGVRVGPIGNVVVRLRAGVEPVLVQRVHVTGRLRLPVDQPGFDRRAYLAQKHAYLEMAQPRLTVTGGEPGLRAIPSWLRARYREAVDQLLPAPHAAVLLGVTLGIRTGIPPRLQRDLISTGLVHLLVLSGLKVSVFARLARAALRPFLGRLAALPVLALIGLYALVGGTTPSAVRSAAMGGLTLVAAELGRPSHVWTSLAAAAAAMLAWRPELAWDVGFQLSFAGTAAIVLLTPACERHLGWMPGWLREPFAVTCAAQVGTVPLMATDFHLLSPIAPLANAAVLPALPVMIAAGLLVPLLAAIPEVGRLLALPLVGLLAYLEQVATLLARVPAAAVPVPRFPVAAGAAYYSGLGGILVWLRAPARWRRLGLAAAVSGPLLLGTVELAGWADSPPTVTVLAVGDGQAVLAGGPAGHVLIDGGPSPTRLRDELGQRLPPWNHELAGLALTGSGLGQVGGLAGLDHPVRLVMLPSAPLPGSSWRTAVLTATARGARLQMLQAGRSFRLAGLEFNVLAPESGDFTGLALQIRRPGGRSFCDMGELDLESQARAAVWLRGGCDYLLLPAGGRSTPAAELLRLAGHPQLVASLASGRLARGLPADLLRTDQEGSIDLRL